MALGAIEGTLSTIAICGGVGAFIDFWIGKRGEKRVKDWLETWWLRFSYVNARNFGREEAIFAVEIMDRLFGRKFFSFRRFALCAVLLVIDPLMRIAWRKWIALINYTLELDYPVILTSIALTGIVSVILFYFVSFFVSLSLTRAASARAVQLTNKWPSLVVAVVFGLLIIQYAMMVSWSWLDNYAQYHNQMDMERSNMDWLNDYGRRYDKPNFSWLPDLSSQSATWMFTNVGRFCLAVLFGGSYILKPLHRILSLAWARMIESDKPVFTLLFGGGAAVAKAIEAFIQALEAHCHCL